MIIIAKKAKPFSISMKDEDKDRLVSYCSTNNLNRSAFVNDVVNRAITSSYCSSNITTSNVTYSSNCNHYSPDEFDKYREKMRKVKKEKD